MKRVLITGGLGFIGLNLASDLLDHGYSLTLIDNSDASIHDASRNTENPVLTRDRVEVHRADVTDGPQLRELMAGVDSIVHLAAETGTAQSMYDIARYNWVNSQGTAVLLDVLANHPHSVRKLILASSRSIYGEGAYRCAACGVVYPAGRPMEALQAHRWELPCPCCGGPADSIPTPESAPPSPVSIYAATKLAQESLVRIACQALGIGHVILRLQNVYGEGQSLDNPYTGILSIFSTRIRGGQSVPIFEDGLESRDFVHVVDAVKAIRLGLENDQAGGHVLNVGSGKPTTVLEVANLLMEALGGRSGAEITGHARLGDIRHGCADLSLTSKILGFYPEVSLQRGLERFTRWVESQPLHEDGLERANNELRRRKLMG